MKLTIDVAVPSTVVILTLAGDTLDTDGRDCSFKISQGGNNESSFGGAKTGKLMIILLVPAHQPSKMGTPGGLPDYLMLWQGLPYSESTWEDGALVSKRYPVAIEEYNLRNKSQKIPSKLCKVGFLQVQDRCKVN